MKFELSTQRKQTQTHGKARVFPAANPRVHVVCPNGSKLQSYFSKDLLMCATVGGGEEGQEISVGIKIGPGVPERPGSRSRAPRYQGEASCEGAVVGAVIHIT